jgi:hypothetical protein
MIQEVPLKTVLKNEGNTFVMWRYPYEGNIPSGTILMAGPLVNALVSLIREIKPDWK